jgi:hypothetical protein
MFISSTIVSQADKERIAHGQGTLHANPRADSLWLGAIFLIFALLTETLSECFRWAGLP